MSNRRQAEFLNLFLFCSIIGLCSCSQGKHADSVKFQQYYIQGEVLYKKHCSNCHQADGTGLGLVYPPLNTSDFMENNFEEVICLMKYGREGELIVNGKSYIQPMPGIPSLTNLEIAEIATYIYNTWEHQRGMVDVTQVSKIIDRCEP